MTQHKQPPHKSLVHHKTSFGSKKLLIVFLVVVVVITGSIAYYTLSKTTITITRAEFPIRSTFLATVSETADDDITILGSFDVVEVSHSYTKETLGEKTTITGKSTGTIRVINSWNQTQILQETTRFLSPDGILFRTTERVDIPAGSEAMVPVVADQDGPSGDIAADTRFTIPGLWAGLQDSIYGVNDEQFTGGQQTVSFVTQKEIDEAQTIALEELKEKAKHELSVGDGTKIQIPVFKQLLLNQSNVAAGSAAESLTLTLKGEFVRISFDPTTLHQALYDRLVPKLTEDEELVSIDLSQLETEVDRISEDGLKLQIKMSAVGNARNLTDAAIFLPHAYYGMTEAELKAFAEQETGITDISVTFSPFWATQVPTIAQRVKLHIQ